MSDSSSVALCFDCGLVGHGCDDAVFGECDGKLELTGLKLCGLGCSGLSRCDGEVLGNRDAEYKLFGGLNGKKPAPGICGTIGNGRCGAANILGGAIPFMLP